MGWCPDQSNNGRDVGELSHWRIYIGTENGVEEFWFRQECIKAIGLIRPRETIVQDESFAKAPRVTTINTEQISEAISAKFSLKLQAWSDSGLEAPQGKAEGYPAK